MKRGLAEHSLRWIRVRALPVVLCVACSATQAAAGDERILAAHDAARANDRAKLAQLAASGGGHPLDQYVNYWALRARSDTFEPAAVLDFLKRHEGDYLAERLRGEWLKELGRTRNWPLFGEHYGALFDPDQELRCYALHARHLAGDTQAAEQAKGMWLNADLPESCHQFMLALISESRVDHEAAWERVRRLAEGRRVTAAKAVVPWLPPGEQPDLAALELAVNSPEAYLNRLPKNFSIRRGGRELAMIAIARLARSDAAGAATRWQSIAQRFSTDERGWVATFLGQYSAQQHLGDALAWFKAAGDTPLSEEQSAWKVRAALRAQNWRVVKSAIEAMADRQRAEAAWTYWFGRANAALGDLDAAFVSYAKLSGQANFYGNLADDELGRPIQPPEKAAKPTDAEIAAAANDPSIRRALLLLRLGSDMRMEAIREWNWALRNRDDRFLLAAADVAQRNEVWDRAISAADRTNGEHNYDLRYLAPFKELVAPRARELGLDPAWVYGLMRQESRFVMSVRSSAGAQGLMQLMPATAKWVAKRIGLKDFSLARVTDMDTNVTLGTHYLSIVYSDLGNDPVLASAAYNAGPGRARKWRDSKPLEAAIYIEGIPFNETRDYVKKVMSNAVFYAAQFEGKPQSLKSRLGNVRPANGAETVPDTP